MTKDEAIKMFGSGIKAAKFFCVERTTFSKWPNEIPTHYANKVDLMRISQELKETKIQLFELKEKLAKNDPDGAFSPTPRCA